MERVPLDIEDADALLAYLRESGRIVADSKPRIRVLAGGVSNRTVLVEGVGAAGDEACGASGASGGGWVLKQALPKLRVQVDWFADPARIEREALGLQYLEQLAPPQAITPLVFLDRANHLLAMQAVPQPHENWKTMLLAGRLDPNHVQQFAHLLATIHRRAWERRGELAAIFDDRSFFESLRLEPYYAFTAEQVEPARPFLDELITRTRQRRLTLVHGDYSPKNVLVVGARVEGRGPRGRQFRESRPHAPTSHITHHTSRIDPHTPLGPRPSALPPALILLDHEVIHWGDPAFDLGFSMTHLLSKAHHLPERRADFAQATLAYWSTYRAALGDLPFAADLETHAVRHTLGCLLARVRGRSPLEYLDDRERSRQAAAVLALLSDPPVSISDLARRFVGAL